MPYTTGGRLSNLLLGYNTGDDDQLQFGWPVQLAQTFTLTQTTAIHQIVTLVEPPFGAYMGYCAIFNTDGEGKPTGAPIDSSGWHSEERYMPIKWRWHCFRFRDFPLLAPGLYAIVLSWPLTGVPPPASWRNDKTSPTYTQGKAYRSLNSGGSWSELAGRDFMFEVWGWNPPPDPPPDPAITNWAPLDKTEVSLQTGFKLTVTTDIPCHLYMRWTNEEPLKHPSSRWERGIKIMTGLRYCFVAFHENEQLEEGDTYEHTFDKRGWAVCETRWFYFIGTVQRTESPSCSPIFHLHRTAEIISSTFGPAAPTTSHRTAWQTNVDWPTCHNAALAFRVNTLVPPDYLMLAGCRLTASFFIYRNFLFFDTSTIPVGSDILSAKLSIFVKGKWCNIVTWRHLCITKGVQSDPVILADYGDQHPYIHIAGWVDMLTLTPGVYTDIPFFTSGLDLINPGGITRLCLRAERDVIDYSTFTLYSSHLTYYGVQKGADYWPLLTVTYVPP